MRVVFASLSTHAACVDVEAAIAYWGAAGWAAVSICLSLLLDSLDLADLRRWAGIELRVADGLIRIGHGDAVVSLIPLLGDGTAVAINKEDSVKDLQHVRGARVVDVSCNGKLASKARIR